MKKNKPKKPSKIDYQNPDAYLLRITGILEKYVTLPAKTRARIVSNIEEVFAKFPDKIKQERADDFEFIFYIFKEAQNILNPDVPSDGRPALSDIKAKVLERYPNIKSVYDTRRASLSYAEFQKMTKAEWEEFDRNGGKANV